MVVKLMSLGLDKTPQIIQAQEKIESAVEQYLECSTKFTQYNNEKNFLIELSNSVKQDDIILLSTESELFLPFKSFVTKAFQLKKRPNKKIARLIKSCYPEMKYDTESFQSQATIPVGAVPLLSNDGLYSGFAIKAKKQIVFVLPLDLERLDAILHTDMAQYIFEVLPDTNETLQEEKNQNFETNKSPYDEELIKNTVQKLSDNQLCFSMADTNTNDFIINISNNVVDLSQVVSISDYSVEKGKMPAKEYAIKLARGAKERQNTPIGACLTKVFTVNKEDGTKDMFQYVCIADEKQANAKAIYLEQGQTLPQLIFSTVNELFKMVSSWADTEEVIPTLSDETNTEELEVLETTGKKGKNKLRIIVTILFVLSIVVSIIIAVKFDDIYNIRGTLAQKSQTQMYVDSSESLHAENVGTETDSTIKKNENRNGHGGVELDAAFIDSINKKSTSAKSTTTKKPTEKTLTTTKKINNNKSKTTTKKTTTTTKKPSSSYPEKILLNGKKVNTAQALARIVQAEMGSSFNTEALKAQTVAAFSYIKSNNWSTSGLSSKSTYSNKVMNAVKSVLGQTVTYNGKTAYTPFFAISAGKTVPSNKVWNIYHIIPYLSGGVVSAEKNAGVSRYKTTKTYSSSELKKIIEKNLGVKLGEDPFKWIKINSHDSNVNANVGYVSSITVGNKTITGHYFRTRVLKYGIRSHCFNITYNDSSDVFTFTVYGYGHGVGMSQQGANYYANQGWNYQKILKHYFPGTQIKTSV